MVNARSLSGVPAVAAAVIGSAALAAPSAALASPDYQVPFPCGQSWAGSTRESHSSWWAIDFNRYEDEGDLVVASAPGRVYVAEDQGDSGYGKYVMLDHGRDHFTRHGHLSSRLVVTGETVDVGDPLGRVGDTGYSFGAHLHYEQRFDGTVQPAVFDGAEFEYNSEITSANCPTVPVVGDWNGDQATDVGAYKRGPVSGKFRKRFPSGEKAAVRYGIASDTAVTGDWDGNGRTDMGIWRQGTHRFYLLMPDGATKVIDFGKARDKPVTGDWNGDRVTDVGVWRPGTAQFLLRFPNGAVSSYALGTTNDLPLSGDWNGDGRWDVGVYDPGTSTFTLRYPSGSVASRVFGRKGDLPVVGDWSGDGRSNVGIWRPSTAEFHLRYDADRVERIRFGRIR